MTRQRDLVTKTFTGLFVTAGILTVVGSPVWGLSPLVIVAAAGLAAAAVTTILLPPEM